MSADSSEGGEMLPSLAQAKQQHCGCWCSVEDMERHLAAPTFVTVPSNIHHVQLRGSPFASQAIRAESCRPSVNICAGAPGALVALGLYGRRVRRRLLRAWRGRAKRSRDMGYRRRISCMATAQQNE
eukprot:6000090-Amphidinium_carterae.1